MSLKKIQIMQLISCLICAVQFSEGSTRYLLLFNILGKLQGLDRIEDLCDMKILETVSLPGDYCRKIVLVFTLQTSFLTWLTYMNYIPLIIIQD